MNRCRFFLAVILFSITGFAISLANAQSNATQVPDPTLRVPIIPRPQPVTAANPSPVDTFLHWDASLKEAIVSNGTPEANFVFNLTNVSDLAVTITSAHASCGCTVAKLPEQPWVLAPGTNSELHVTMNLAGKVGEVTKTITVTTDKGIKILFVKSNIKPQPAPQMGDRDTNQKMALADRQAVFKSECAKCHTEPTKGKAGLALYIVACGICHEAEHRASMVPNLRALPVPTNAEFWRNWTTHGKEGTLMPAFSEKEGGILSDAQIESLVTYLSRAIPSQAQPQPVLPAGKTL